MPVSFYIDDSLIPSKVEILAEWPSRCLEWPSRCLKIFLIVEYFYVRYVKIGRVEADVSCGHQNVNIRDNTTFVLPFSNVEGDGNIIVSWNNGDWKLVHGGQRLESWRTGGLWRCNCQWCREGGGEEVVLLGRRHLDGKL